MAAKASTPYNVNIATPLKTGQLPRPVVFLGSHRDYIEDIARDNNLSWTFADNTLHIGQIQPGPDTPDLISASLKGSSSRQTSRMHDAQTATRAICQ